MGGDGALRPTAVLLSVAADEYLVVWRGTDNTGALVAEAYEVFGQRLTGS